MQLLEFISNKLRAFSYLMRAFRHYYFFRKIAILIGKNLIIRGGKIRPKIADNLIIYENVIIEAHNKDAQLHIDKNCVLSYGVIISCTTAITIGQDVWIGEYSSIRDSTHQFLKDIPLSFSEDLRKPIVIGNNVWIGRNTIVLPGARIGNNVVIGANSLVSGTLMDGALYAGSPAVFKKYLA